MSKTEFRQVDLDALGYPKGDIRDWLDAGHIKASIKQADGVGTRNVYSRDDVLRIIALRALVRVGFTLRLAIILADAVNYHQYKYGNLDEDEGDNFKPAYKRMLLEDSVLSIILNALGMHSFAIHKIKSSAKSVVMP